MMQRTTYTIVTEPRGVVYRSLCEFAEGSGLDVLFVVRDRPAMSEDGMDLLRNFERCIIDRRRAGEWPGTQLLGHTATVIVMRPDAAEWALLRRAADGLFDWQHPALPEDLCFLRGDGSTYLGSIAHEKDAFLELDQEERDALLQRVPSLAVQG